MATFTRHAGSASSGIRLGASSFPGSKSTRSGILFCNANGNQDDTMSYIGDIALEKTFDTKFTTVTTTGAPTVLAGSPVISAYVDNSLTQITAGITLSVDFDGVVGLNNVRVVATAANGYAAGSNYQLVITTGTVGGTSVVGYVVAEFSILARSALRPTTADRTLDVSAGGESGLDWANIGSPTTAQNLSATNIDVDQIVASVSGAVASVTAGVTVTTNNDKTGYALTAGERTSIASAIFATVIEGAHTFGDAVRLFLSVLTGKSSGGGTATITFRDLADSKNRISATVDANGNRTAVGTRDGT